MAIPDSKEVLQNLAALATVLSFFVLLITLFHRNRASLPEVTLLLFIIGLTIYVFFVHYELLKHLKSHKKTYKPKNKMKKMMRGKKGGLSPQIALIILVGLLIIYMILKYGIFE